MLYGRAARTSRVSNTIRNLLCTVLLLRSLGISCLRL